MNKQEALEAVLTEARRYEEPNREVRARPEQEIGSELLDAARDLDLVITKLLAGDVTVRTNAQYRNRLLRVAGAALALLVTEVEVVEGKALDQWLNEGGADRQEPTPVNGSITGRKPVQIHYVPPPFPSPQIIVIGEDGRARRA